MIDLLGLAEYTGQSTTAPSNLSSSTELRTAVLFTRSNGRDFVEQHLLSTALSLVLRYDSPSGAISDLKGSLVLRCDNPSQTISDPLASVYLVWLDHLSQTCRLFHCL